MRHRRELLKLIGVSPIAAGAVQTNLAEMISSPAVQAGIALTSMAHPTGSDTDPVKALIKKQIKTLLKSASKFQDARKAGRTGAFDADIAALKSVSAVNKQRLQMQRDGEWEEIYEIGWDFIYDD